MELMRQHCPAGTNRLYPFIKRGMDIVIAATALALLWPLFLLLALIVWLDDPSGSPVYASTRCGKEGKPFTLYKFRTMRVNAEAERDTLLSLNEMDGPVFKIRNDPRITRVGRVLRRISLDELPQLYNVLRGDMSLVGPRPPLPDEVARYTQEARARLSVMPGITCTWQVTPNRNAVSFATWLAMDLAYIDARCVWLDTWLLLKTFAAVMRGDGQ